MLGAKHPHALGRPGAEVWAEIRDELAPMFAAIGAGGPPVYAQDAPFAMARGAGAAAEGGWFTYSLSAIPAASTTSSVARSSPASASSRPSMWRNVGHPPRPDQPETSPGASCERR